MQNLSGKYFYFINKKKPIKLMGFFLFISAICFVNLSLL